MPVNTKNDGETIDTRLVRRLADILTETHLTEIEVERGDLKIRVARSAAVAATVIAAPVEPASRGDVVKSPMVGTVYLKSNPDADPFVQVGDRVNQGQTLLIIEAMKTMNPIAAPKAGVVREIVVDNEQPVEFGEPLVVIE